MRNFWFVLGSTASLLVGCGGSSATDGSAGAAGASQGGAAQGGNGLGGNTSSSGATSVAGAAAGGASNGGSSASDTCMSASECSACKYPTLPRQASDCYCANCASASLTKSSCDANQKAWEQLCSKMVRPCPAIACIPGTPACVAGKCLIER